jgi:S-adenosylmethionine-diacylglycerol 3-amino-3-carboxypropyl transferase
MIPPLKLSLSSSAEFSALDHNIIRYSKVWEDYRIASEALNLVNGDHLLIVASAGCNVLNLLLKEPESITCIDLSESQIALTELKIRAAYYLEREEFLSLLGYRNALPHVREMIYNKVRPALSADTAMFWEENLGIVKSGIQSIGRLDTYFSGFWTDQTKYSGRYFVDKISSGEIRAVINSPAVAELQSSFKEYYSRNQMAQRGRSEEQFRYVSHEYDVGYNMWEKFVRAVMMSELYENPYMQAFIYNRYVNIEAMPYLSQSGYARLKPLLDRVRIIRTSLSDAINCEKSLPYTKYYLSNVFEYLPESDCTSILDEIGRKSAFDARVCYWNFLVERGKLSRDDDVALITDEARSRELHARDRSWIYDQFWVSCSACRKD